MEKVENRYVVGGKVDMNKVHMRPIDEVNGYQIRPGLYEMYGATAIPGGVNFTVQSTNATSCELLLFKPGKVYRLQRLNSQRNIKLEMYIQ